MPNLAGSCSSSPVDGGEQGPFGAVAAAQREAARFALPGQIGRALPLSARLPSSSQSRRTLPITLPIGRRRQRNSGNLPFIVRDILTVCQFSRRPSPTWAGGRWGCCRARGRRAAAPSSATGQRLFQDRKLVGAEQSLPRQRPPGAGFSRLKRCPPGHVHSL